MLACLTKHPLSDYKVARNLAVTDKDVTSFGRGVHNIGAHKANGGGQW
jgi:hypothetical protein